MLRRKRTWLGLLLALIGILLARVVSTLTGLEGWTTQTYLLGVVSALGGLAMVASAIQVTSINVIPCPQCYLVNPVEADRCTRCASPLSKGEEQ
ncbi:MAG: hypothetical protein M1358_16690 [Chloroflexi bacterium]|nr:hypothetical protein [Chloroflexota bacterium]